MPIIILVSLLLEHCQLVINLGESPLDLPLSIPQVLDLLQHLWVLNLNLLLLRLRDNHVKMVPIAFSPLDCAPRPLDLFYYVLKLSLRLQNLSTDFAPLHPRLELFICLLNTRHFQILYHHYSPKKIWSSILSDKLTISSVPASNLE